MRVDALISVIAFVIALNSILTAYRLAIRTLYAGTYKCWLNVEKIAHSLTVNSRVSPHYRATIYVIDKKSQAIHVIGLIPWSTNCYTFRILRNGTLLRVELGRG